MNNQMPKLIEQAFINIEGAAEPKVHWKFWEMVAILYMSVINATSISVLGFISFYIWLN